MDALQRKLNEIQKLPHFSRRKALNSLYKYPNHPRHLYKYKNINPKDAQSVKNVRDIIVHSNLWYSSPWDFNDPFDLSAKVYSDAPANEKRKRLREILKTNGVKTKDLESTLNKNMRDGGNTVEDYMASHNKTYREALGVISLASKPRDILMWSHYAANHTGICLQFEIAHDVPVFGNAIPVQYSDEYPIIDWARSFPEDIQSSLLRKFKGWRYEQEYRILEIDKARTRLPYRTEALTAIIYGCRISEESLELVESFLNERSLSTNSVVKSYKACLHDSDYQINVFAA